ncbi:hypothetical protein ACHAXT_003901 [Thalassiosira profunda]
MSLLDSNSMSDADCDADESLLVSPKASPGADRASSSNGMMEKEGDVGGAEGSQPAVGATNNADTSNQNANGQNDQNANHQLFDSRPSSSDDSFAADRATIRTPAKRRTMDYAAALEELEGLAPTPAVDRKREADCERRDEGADDGRGEEGVGGRLFAEETGYVESPKGETRAYARPLSVDPAAWGSPEVRELTPRQLAELLARSASEGQESPLREASGGEGSGKMLPGPPVEAEEEPPAPEEEHPEDRASTEANGTKATSHECTGVEAVATTETSDSSNDSSDPSDSATAAPAAVFRRPCIRESNPHEPPEMELQMGHPVNSSDDDRATLPDAPSCDDERVTDADLSMEVAKAAECGPSNRELLEDSNRVDELGVVPEAEVADGWAHATERLEDEAGLLGGQEKSFEEEEEAVAGTGNGEKLPRDSLGSPNSNDGPVLRAPRDGPSDSPQLDFSQLTARKGARKSRHFGDHSTLDISRDVDDVAPWDALENGLGDSDDEAGYDDRTQSEYVETMRASIASYFSGRSSVAPSVAEEAAGDGNRDSGPERQGHVFAGDDVGRVHGVQSVTYERFEGVLGELREKQQLGFDAAEESADASPSVERAVDLAPAADEFHRLREQEFGCADAPIDSDAAADKDTFSPLESESGLNAAQESFSSDKGDNSLLEESQLPVENPVEDAYQLPFPGPTAAPVDKSSSLEEEPNSIQMNSSPIDEMVDERKSSSERQLQAKSFCDDVVETSIAGVASQFAAEDEKHEMGSSLDKSHDSSSNDDVLAPSLFGAEAQLFVAMPNEPSPIAKSTSPHDASDLPSQSNEVQDVGREGQDDKAREATAPEEPTALGDVPSNAGDSDGGEAKKASIFQFLSQPTEECSDGILHDASEENGSEENGPEEAGADESVTVEKTNHHVDHSLQMDDEEPSVHDEASTSKRKSSLEDLSSYQQKFSSTSSAFLEQLRGAAEDRKREVTRARYSMERKEQMLYDEKKVRAEMTSLPPVDEEMEEEPPTASGSFEGDGTYRPFKARPLPSTTADRPRRSYAAPAPKSTKTQSKRKTLAPGEDPYVPFKARPVPGSSSSRFSTSLGTKRKSSTAFKPHPAQNKSSYVKDSALNAKPPKRLLSGEDASIAKAISRNQRQRKEEAKIRKDSIFKARPLPASTLARSQGPLVGEELVASKGKVGHGKENGSDAFVPRSSSRAEERAAYDAGRAQREEQQHQDQMERRNTLIERTEREIKDLKRFIR